ncbi:hypothetical protein LINPERHAP2_LOCUS19049, partial [Linum perenne]
MRDYAGKSWKMLSWVIRSSENDSSVIGAYLARFKSKRRTVRTSGIRTTRRN